MKFEHKLQIENLRMRLKEAEKEIEQQKSLLDVFFKKK